MKIITWNLNSIRARLERLLALLKRHQPDVLCIQETKVTDQAFPREAIEQLDYYVEPFGQKSYNGVALLSRVPYGGVLRGFPGDPLPEQARVISADFNDIRVINIYVVNGKQVGTEPYHIKLTWLDRFTDWLRQSHDPSRPLIIVGDFNVAPEEIDVHDPQRWRGRVLFSDPERQRLKAMLNWGLEDLLRVYTQEGELYSWWDYRFGAFARGWGLRIDLLLGTPPIVHRLKEVYVDREERKKSTGPGIPSDHAPVVALFD